MMSENPFTITFGKQPNKYISRYEDTDKIISTFNADNPVSQTFLIEGIRGSGKTVLMTTVAKSLAEEKNWIVINLNPAMDLLSNFAIRLSEECDSTPDDKLFKTLVKKKKRVMITVDEVVNDDNMKVFASQFQIFVREDYPIFLIMTGLHENIYEIQNNQALTFLLRSPKIITGPLSMLQISRQYTEIFEIDSDQALNLAKITKGYAFAFQAMGVSFWNNRDKGLEKVLYEFDELLDDFVYKKVWTTLTAKEKEIVSIISKEEMKTGEICKKLKISAGTFSKYREQLISKGIIDGDNYGVVSLSLPRFYEVIKSYI